MSDKLFNLFVAYHFVRAYAERYLAYVLYVPVVSYLFIVNVIALLFQKIMLVDLFYSLEEYISQKRNTRKLYTFNEMKEGWINNTRKVNKITGRYIK